MKKINLRNFSITGALFLLFAALTVLLRFVDVRPIGPNGSAVGFAAVNDAVHALFGVHMGLYTVTDWLGLVPIFICLIFALLGGVQLFKRKSLRRVDGDILALGGFYILTIGAYSLFEYCVINYRPVLINGVLEASYPSSTTMLTLCVTVTAILQLRCRIKNRGVKTAPVRAPFCCCPKTKCKFRSLRWEKNAGMQPKSTGHIITAFVEKSKI